jgi:hypothetical protein
MFERDYGGGGGHDQRTGSLSVAHKTTQNVSVALARVENPCGRLGEPAGRRFGFGREKRTLEQQVRGDEDHR